MLKALANEEYGLLGGGRVAKCNKVICKMSFVARAPLLPQSWATIWKEFNTINSNSQMLSFMPIKPKFKEAMISNETKSLSERGPEQPPILGSPAGHQRLAQHDFRPWICLDLKWLLLSDPSRAYNLTTTTLTFFTRLPKPKRLKSCSK